MSSSTIDPKLYEAVRRGNERYFKEHALISDAERAAFGDSPVTCCESTTKSLFRIILCCRSCSSIAAFQDTHVQDDEATLLDQVPVPHDTTENNVANDVMNNGAMPEGFVSVHVNDVIHGPEVPTGTEVAAGSEPADTEVPPDPENQQPLYGVTWAGETVLHIAVRFGRTTLAKRICNVTTSFLTMANKKEETPLHYAAQAGNDNLVGFFIVLACEKRVSSYLVDFLQKKNEDGETALYQAIHHQHNKVVQVLMSEDVGQASLPDNKNMSPLYLATMLRSLPIVTTLVEKLRLTPNLEPAAYLGPDGETALHAAAVSGTKCLVQTILNLKEDMTRARADRSEDTPLHYAAFNNNCIAAKMLLKTDRTSAYIANSSGLYPVHVAAKLGFLGVVKALFKQCPDSGELLDNEGKNFVHLAVEANREFVAWWVYKNSIQLQKAMNAQDNNGNTPLHLAVRAGGSNTVNFLVLSKKVQLNWVNSGKLTPLDIAFAQLKSGFSDLQNPDYVIYETLYEIGCTFGIHSCTTVEAETDQQRDKERDTKDMIICEGMAKNMSIGSVLIASAAFAAAFTVYSLYIEKKELYDNPQLKLAFYFFFILDTYAFLCSMTTTGLLVEAALPFVDLQYRKRYLLLCTSLVMLAAKCFMVAFTTAAYIILSPIRKWLAIVIYLVGVVAPLLIQPRTWPNLLVLWTIIKYRRWWGFVRVSFKQCYPLYCKLAYMFFMLVVLSNQQWSPIFFSDQFLVCVIVFLGVISFTLFLFTLRGMRLILGRSQHYHSRTILRTLTLI